MTAQEGMSNGKVVVTLPGRYVRGRFTKMIYEQMGGGESREGWAPIARDEEEFVDLAVRLGTNKANVRQEIKAVINSKWGQVAKDEESTAEWSALLLRAFKGSKSK